MVRTMMLLVVTVLVAAAICVSGFSVVIVLWRCLGVGILHMMVALCWTRVPLSVTLMPLVLTTDTLTCLLSEADVRCGACVRGL